MKKAKRFLAFVLSVILIFSVLPTGTLTAFAETTSGYCGSNLLWEYDTQTDTLTISNTGTYSTEMYNYSYGKTPWFAFEDSIKIVNADSLVSSVGKGAFTNCESLETVNMPGVTKVGDCAFEGCRSLTSLNRF